MYSPSLSKTGTPTINIQSTLGTSVDLCVKFSLQCYLVATLIYIQSVRCQICMYVHMLCTVWRLWSGTALNAEFHFGHACHRLISHFLYKTKLTSSHQQVTQSGGFCQEFQSHSYDCQFILNKFDINKLLSLGNYLPSFPEAIFFMNLQINPLAPEFPFKFQHTLYLKCE